MKRIFGTKKEKPPTPTIDEASGRLTTRGDTYVPIETPYPATLLLHLRVSSAASANGSELQA